MSQWKEAPSVSLPLPYPFTSVFFKGLLCAVSRDIPGQPVDEPCSPAGTSSAHSSQGSRRSERKAPSGYMPHHTTLPCCGIHRPHHVPPIQGLWLTLCVQLGVTTAAAGHPDPCSLTAQAQDSSCSVPITQGPWLMLTMPVTQGPWLVLTVPVTQGPQLVLTMPVTQGSRLVLTVPVTHGSFCSVLGLPCTCGQKQVPVC